MSNEEKSYDDYFEELYGDGPKEEAPEPEQEEEQVEQEQEQASEQETEAQQEEEESPKRMSQEERDEYEELLTKVEDPDLKKDIQQLIQSDRSQRGRVSALTKKLNKLQEYYNNAISQAPAGEGARGAQAPASTAKKEEPEGRKEDEELPPEVAALKESAPAVYKAAKALYESSSRKDLDRVRQEYEERIKPLEESAVREANQKEAQRLEKMAAELFDSENTGITVRDVIGSSDFAAWLKGQPAGVRNIYRNARTADEAILVLNKFENDYEYMSKLNEQLNPKQETQNERKEEPEANKGDELRAKRETRKKTSVSPKSKSAATAAVDSTDYDKLFDHFWGESGVYRTRRN